MNILITGGSGGIGRQTAIALANKGYNVIITGRSIKTCMQALMEIKDKSGNNNIDYIVADFSSLSSIQNLADEYRKKFITLDILINNVGTLLEQKEFTTDGIEKNYAINALFPYFLSVILSDLLSQSNIAKVISVSGGMHSRRIDLKNVQAEKRYLGIINYSQSKMIMMTLMNIYFQAIEGSNIKSNICYPGQANTAMTQSLTAQMFPLYFGLFLPILRITNRLDKRQADESAARAARSSIYLADNSEAHLLNNAYINYKCKRVPFPGAVLDKENQYLIRDYTHQIIYQKLGIKLNDLYKGLAS
jgi:NAD(P)-dependent dehydrogenase (short-subunit alcohol dehydrogenase family)